MMKIQRLFLLTIVSICLNCGGSKTQKRQYSDFDIIDDSLSTPKATLIKLLAFLQEENWDLSNQHFIIETQRIKNMILTHDLTMMSTHAYLTELSQAYPNTKVHAKIVQIRADLSSVDNYRLLWNDFYGRVFDTIFVNELIKHPPLMVIEAMEQYGLVLVKRLEKDFVGNDHLKKQLNQGIYKLLTEEDKRFWFPKVSDLYGIVKRGPDSATELLIKFLKSPISNGLELIARPYLVAKISLTINDLGHKTSYLEHSNKLFYPLEYLVKGIRINIPKPKEPFGQGGIGLPGHPPILRENWMLSTTRPTAWRFPKVRDFQENTSKKARRALFHQLKHGVTWASGFSGSTSINLHAWKENISKNSSEEQTLLSFKSTLLGTLMFLVYDGGHSIYEVLWVANEFCKVNNLGIILGKGGVVEDFIADFTAFLKIYQGTEAYQRVELAFERALDKMIHYSIEFDGKEPLHSMLLSGYES